MNKFTKAVIAVSGLTLSLAACAPAFKGQGTTKTNLGKAFLKEQAAHKAAISLAPHAGKVSRSAKTEDGYKVAVELKNVDLDPSGSKVVELDVVEAGAQGTGESMKEELSNTAKYIVEVACIDVTCGKMVVVVTTKELAQEAGAEAAKAQNTDEAQGSEEQATKTQPVATDGNTDAQNEVVRSKTGKIVEFISESKSSGKADGDKTGKGEAAEGKSKADGKADDKSDESKDEGKDEAKDAELIEGSDVAGLLLNNDLDFQGAVDELMGLLTSAETYKKSK